ncbi:hypothetical protein ES707_21262 [subsurface metagenome]
MDKYSKEFLNKTIEIWQPYSSTPLSLNDARDITENMTALFNFLIASESQSNDKSINKNILSRKKICLNLKLQK